MVGLKRKNLISDRRPCLNYYCCRGGRGARVGGGGGLYTDCFCHPSHTFELATSVVLFDVVVASEVFGFF